MAHSRETAQQVRSEYMDTMAKIYYSYFKDYYSKLMKIQVSLWWYVSPPPPAHPLHGSMLL